MVYPAKGFVNTDWGGDLVDRKSTSGYAFKVFCALISSASSKQKSVALSSTEAEFMGLSDGSRKLVWLRKFLTDLKIPLTAPTPIYEDNQGAIALVENPIWHKRSKHIDIWYHYTRDVCAQGELKLIYIPTQDQIADIFTKPLSRFQFEKLRTQLGVVSTYSSQVDT